MGKKSRTPSVEARVVETKQKFSGRKQSKKESRKTTKEEEMEKKDARGRETK
jgi:hypothetical protein